MSRYKTWTWLLTIPIAFAIYFYGEALILKERPTAGTFDWGVFEVPLLVLVLALIYKTISILFINLTFPSLFRYYLNRISGGMRKDLERLTPAQRVCLLTAVFLTFYLSFILISGHLMSGGVSMQLPPVR